MREAGMLPGGRKMHRVLVGSIAVGVLLGGCRREPASTRPAGGSDAPVTSTGARPERGAAREEAREEPAARGDRESGRMVGMTAAHDRVRARVKVGPMEWSEEMAAYAQRWADRLKQRGCDLQHRPRSGADAQKYGENIFSATGQTADAAMVVETWAAELADYDAKKNRCKGVCGHYTQIVWRKSQRLGCGMASCGDTEVWVCNYDPPGNFLGQRPY